MLFSEDTLADFFEKQVERLPDHEFLIYPDRNLRFTYSEFNERANNLAKGLLSIGVGKGDHVGIWAKNVPEWLTFMFATAKIGAVLVTVNTAYKSHELEYILKQSDMKALALTDRFRDNNYIDIIYDLVPELKTCQRGKLTSEKFPCLKHVIHVGQDKHRGMYNTTKPDCESSGPDAAQRAAVVAMLERNVCQLTTPVEQSLVDEWLADTSFDWIEAAIRQAALNKAASLKYVDTILQAWRKKYLPGDQPWLLEARRKGRSSPSSGCGGSFIDQLAELAQEAAR